MKKNFFVFLIILSIVIIIPAAYAQNLSEDSKQKSIEVVISSSGDMKVTHVISILDTPTKIELIDGTISNLTVRDQEGMDVQYGEFGIDNSLMIFPSRSETVIEYDLSDKLILKDNIWTLEFLYLESTSFIFPEQVDLIFVNNTPAYLGEKNGILCHGCQMVLEYSLDEPKNFEIIKIEEEEFLIEIRTWDKIDNFNFDPIKGISFQVKGNNNFVTTVIPINFLSIPYQVSLNEEKIEMKESFNNATHVWLNFRPQSSGEVSIIGTVVPEIVLQQDQLMQVGILIIGIIVVGAIIVGIFFFKRKK